MPDMNKEEKNERCVLDGYVFESRQEYEQAKRELEMITYLRSELDMTDHKKLLAVYEKLVKGKNFRTPVGIGFLREMQRYLVRKDGGNDKGKDRISMIPVPAAGNAQSAKSGGTGSRSAGTGVSGQKDGKQEALNAMYRTKLRNLRIVIGILAALVLGLFVFTFQDRFPSDIEKEREKILDEYAGWKEELELREQELREREKALNER